MLAMLKHATTLSCSAGQGWSSFPPYRFTTRAQHLDILFCPPEYGVCHKLSAHSNLDFDWDSFQLQLVDPGLAL